MNDKEFAGIKIEIETAHYWYESLQKIFLRETGKRWVPELRTDEPTTEKTTS